MNKSYKEYKYRKRDEMDSIVTYKEIFAEKNNY